MSLKVIGAGHGRTGTASIKLALEMLGLGRCYHMTEVIMDPARAPLWVQAAEGHPDWDAIFEGYGATVDAPGSHFWRELAAHYPSAKVLLSVRDPDKWFESTQETVFAPERVDANIQGPLQEFFAKVVLPPYASVIHDRAALIDAFVQHNEAVKREISADRLLVYDVAEGWTPLCGFLGVPVPDAPFPHVNTRGDFKAMVAAREKDGAGADYNQMMAAKAKT